MELVLKRNLDEILPAAIEFNFDELKQQLTAFVAKYEGKVVRPENEAEGKADRAGLNRLEAAFETARKRVKARCLAPYQAFEAKVKELTGLIAPVRNAIDEQLKAMETMRKSVKRGHVLVFLEEQIGDLKGIVNPERVWDERWLNATCPDSKWQTEIVTRIAAIRRDLDSIRMVAPANYLDAARFRYLETFDLPGVLSYLNERKEADARFAARLKAEQERVNAMQDELREAGRAAVEAAKAAEAEDAQAVQQEQQALPPEEDTPPPVPQADEPIEEYVLRFRGTRAQLLGLRDYMREHGIWYSKVAETGEAAE